MVFFGFYCVRKVLIGLNLLFAFLAIVLISVAAYANSISVVSTSMIGAIIFCGVFLFLISLVGLLGTLKHHQVLLFLYMVTLGLCFAIQFVVACVCLSVVSASSHSDLLYNGWQKLSDATVRDTQDKFNCCGFSNETAHERRVACPPLARKPCLEQVQSSFARALSVTGGIGLAFSFINLFGVWMAMRFRNQRDPKCNPNAFL